MKMSKYNLVSDGTNASVTVFEDGDMLVANSDNPNWEQIVEALLVGEPVADLINLVQAVAKKFERLTTRVSISGDQVYFDGDPVNNTLTAQIVRFLNEGWDFEGLVNFYEKIAANPSAHSRDQLYTWLEAHNFTIDKDGFILMYKGVRDNGDGTYGSIHAGPAIVNGQEVNGIVPQTIGDTVEFPRSKVNADPSQGCSTGLHASNFDYARSFTTGAVLTVSVDPADVVSVPTDCDAQKVRVCRYTVRGVTTYEIPEASVDWDDEDEENELIGQWIETENHEGEVVDVQENPRTDKYWSVLLDDGYTESWVSIPK
jgi:hypothetical protein